MVALSNASENTAPIRVLLVEDEAISRRALTILLQSRGFLPTPASSAEEALQLLAGGAQPRMALVDLDLPGMNGLELIDQLAKEKPAIPAVLITASSRERLNKSLEGHDVLYMRKPLDVNRLLTLLPPSTDIV